MMRYCTKCGEQIMEGSLFCPACGTQVQDAQPEGGEGYRTPRPDKQQPYVESEPVQPEREQAPLESGGWRKALRVITWIYLGCSVIMSIVAGVGITSVLGGPGSGTVSFGAAIGVAAGSVVVAGLLFVFLDMAEDIRKLRRIAEQQDAKHIRRLLEKKQ